MCKDWVKKYSIRFDKVKYKLFYLIYIKIKLIKLVCFGKVVLTLESKVRVLRVWLDYRLNWNYHMEEIRKKMKR